VEQATDPAVAIDERVDHLELRVDVRETDQGRVGLVVPVQVLLECRQRLLHLIDGRRHVAGVIQQATRSPDPVLGMAKLPEALLLAPGSRHQALVQLLDEAAADPFLQVRDPTEPVPGGVDDIGESNLQGHPRVCVLTACAPCGHEPAGDGRAEWG